MFFFFKTVLSYFRRKRYIFSAFFFFFVNQEIYVTGLVIYNDFTVDLHRESIGTSGKRIYVLCEPIVTGGTREFTIFANWRELYVSSRIRIKVSTVSCYEKDLISSVNLFPLFFVQWLFPFSPHFIIILQPCFSILKRLCMYIRDMWYCRENNKIQCSQTIR